MTDLGVNCACLHTKGLKQVSPSQASGGERQLISGEFLFWLKVMLGFQNYWIDRMKKLAVVVASACFVCLSQAPILAQPVITGQPQNQFLAPGQQGKFSISTAGATPITFQWLFNDTLVFGATNRLFSVPDPQPAQWGCYSVIVSNLTGSVSSQVAELKVFAPASHSLSAIQVQSNGSVRLRISGETSRLFGPYYDLYPLEISSSLVDWTPLVTLQRASSALASLTFVDTNAAPVNLRFYRTPTNQLTTATFPPTGPYSVGTFSMVMIDPSRTNVAGKTNYQFMTTFWYPTVAQAGVLPAKYVESQVAFSGLYDTSTAGGANFSSQTFKISVRSKLFGATDKIGLFTTSGDITSNFFHS